MREKIKKIGTWLTNLLTALTFSKSQIWVVLEIRTTQARQSRSQELLALPKAEMEGLSRIKSTMQKVLQTYMVTSLVKSKANRKTIILSAMTSLETR